MISILVLFHLLVILAAAIPNISLVINLVGAISSSTIAIIFPPLVHLVIVWDTKSNYILVKVRKLDFSINPERRSPQLFVFIINAKSNLSL